MRYYLLISLLIPVDEQTSPIIKEALSQVGNIFTDTPDKITQIRPSLDLSQYIVEVYQNTTPTKDDFTPQLAQYLNIEEQTIDGGYTLFVFDDVDDVRQYLINNKDLWESSVV